MEKIFKPLLILCFIFTTCFSTTRSFAQTRLGLQYTLEEVNIWKERAKVGPYRVQSDVSPNTPGDWTRIVSGKNSFVASPKASLWGGPPGSGCVIINNSQKEGTDVPVKRLVGYMQDAAFYAMLFNDASIKKMVKDELLLQTKQSGTNFSNSGRWCAGKVNDNSPNFEVAIWGVMLVYTYDYVKDVFSDSEKQVFLNWINGLASYLQKELDAPLNQLFKNRGAARIEDYVYVGGTSKGDRVYAGGYQTTTLQRNYNNRRAHMMHLVGLVGILNNNTSYINSAKNFIRETIAFMCYPNGAFGELHRSLTTLPSKGLNYLTNTFGAMILVADALARTGDFSMYDFKTTFGIGETKGTTVKSLEWAITEHGKYLDGHKNVYEKSMRIGDPNAKIDGNHSSWIMMNDATNFAIANIYYKNSYNKSIYMRTTPGIYPYPASHLATNGTTIAWKGLCGHTAGLFMYGQMEGKVWPYPGRTSPGSTTPTPTANVAPKVNAGTDITATLPLSTLNVTGSATDSDGSIATYKWTKQSGPAITMSATDKSTLALSAITAGTYTFRLTASDDKGASAYDEVNVIVKSATTTPTTTTPPASTTPTTPPPTTDSSNFYRAINLNGSATTIDGNNWEGSSSAANFSYSGRSFSLQTADLNPATDINRAGMIKSSIWKALNTDYVSVSMNAMPNATYQVYVYVWEDNYSTNFTMYAQGVKIGAYSSGSKGSWKKISLGKVKVTDGTLLIKAQGGDACLSGIEVWKDSVSSGTSTTPTTTTSSFYRAINLNGPATTIDGNHWESSSSASNFSYSGRSFSLQTLALNPATDANRTAMIRSSIWKNVNTDYVTVTMGAMPNATYEVYVYVWEDNYSTNFTLYAEGIKIGAYSSGTKGSWKKISLGKVKVSDGNLVVKAQGGDACLSGLEVWRAADTARLGEEVTTAIAEEASQSQYKAYPNPFTSSITVALNPQEVNAPTLEWSVMDFSGAELRSGQHSINDGSTVQLDNLADLKTGVYLIKLKSGISERMVRVIKK